MLRAVAHRARPRLHKYDVFTIGPGPLDATLLRLCDRFEGYTVLSVSEEMLPAIDSDYPGYSSTAKRYLDQGGIGLSVWSQGRLASMLWIAYNGQPHRQRRAGYYPLDPWRAYLHAGITLPDFRGRGLHKAMLVQCSQYVQDTYGPTVVETTAEIHNDISRHNCFASGFALSGRLYLFSMPRLEWAWKRMFGPR